MRLHRSSVSIVALIAAALLATGCKSACDELEDVCAACPQETMQQGFAHLSCDMYIIDGDDDKCEQKLDDGTLDVCKTTAAPPPQQ